MKIQKLCEAIETVYGDAVLLAKIGPSNYRAGLESMNACDAQMGATLNEAVTKLVKWLIAKERDGHDEKMSMLEALL